MKYFLLFTLLFALSCSQQKGKKSPQKNIKTEAVIETKKEIVSKEIEETPIKKEASLIAVLKNPKDVTDTKALVENSSLVWENLIIDKNTLKIAEIKVPLDKVDFWKERLENAGVFSSIQIKNDAILSELKEKAANTFVNIRKKECSGDCPVYELTVFKDGTVFFNGIDNVLKKGKQTFKISEVQLEKITKKFNQTSFGTYLDSYVDKSLMDYPSTFIVYNDKQIEIKLWKNVPDELAFAYEAVEDILIDKKIIE